VDTHTPLQEVDLKPKLVNGISESNAKALEAAVAKIMTDYWSQHQMMNNQHRGSDSDLFTSTLNERSINGNSCCKHCTLNRLAATTSVDAQTQTGEEGGQSDAKLVDAKQQTEHNADRSTIPIYQNGH